MGSLERRLQTMNDRLERTTRSAAEAKNEAAALRGDLDDARYQLGVVERASGDLIGRIGCWNPEGWPGFEVGWLLRRASWGRGFATEGARAALIC